MEESCVAMGLDIGGANLKGAAVEVDGKGRFRLLYSCVRDFSLTTRDIFEEVSEEVGGVDVVGVTSTAEYSLRLFRTLGDGIMHYCRDLSFIHGPRILWVNTDGGLVDNGSLRDPYAVAAANWVASAAFIGRYVLKDCILVDVGSTTTDIVPVKDGKPCSNARFDWERLGRGELVYTGAINTGVGSILRRINVAGTESWVSSEDFSISGDVHLICGNISELTFRSYTRGNNAPPKESLTRLAHMVCADDMLLERRVIEDMARQVWKKQVSDISSGLRQVYESQRTLYRQKPPVICCGLGAEFLGARAARACGFDRVTTADRLWGFGVPILAPAVAMAVMAGNGSMEGR